MIHASLLHNDAWMNFFVLLYVFLVDTILLLINSKLSRRHGSRLLLINKFPLFKTNVPIHRALYLTWNAAEHRAQNEIQTAVGLFDSYKRCSCRVASFSALLTFLSLSAHVSLEGKCQYKSPQGSKDLAAVPVSSTHVQQRRGEQVNCGFTCFIIQLKRWIQQLRVWYEAICSQNDLWYRMSAKLSSHCEPELKRQWIFVSSLRTKRTELQSSLRKSSDDSLRRIIKLHRPLPTRQQWGGEPDRYSWI